LWRWSIALLLSGASADAAISVRVLRDGAPQAGVAVMLESASFREERQTDDEGVARFSGIRSGSVAVSAAGVERTLFVSDESLSLVIDLDAPSGRSVPFGRTDLTFEDLSRLPNAGTLSSVLETIEPFAVTNRIDVAGVESATEPVWGVRGSSWTQNVVRLDGIDVTDPSGGEALFYPDVFFFEDVALVTAEKPPAASGPGAELALVTRRPPPALGAAFKVRYTGEGLQSENLGERLLDLGVEPREMVRFPALRFEVGAPRVYAAVNGFHLETGIPHFDAEEEASLVSVAGKLVDERVSLLGIVQRFDRPTFGAEPRFSTDAVVDATETFQIAQASFRVRPVDVRLGFARGELDSDFSGTGFPVRDLSTGEVSGAPPIVVEEERTRWTAVLSSERLLGRHFLRAGAELSRASENGTDRVPGDRELFTVDGVSHSIAFFTGPAERSVSVSRLAFHAEDALFANFAGLPWRLAPGLRLDFSRSGPIGWKSLSGRIAGGVQVKPTVELHFSLSSYPHVLTTRPVATTERLTWVLREFSADGTGGVLRRGGGEFTTVASDLPRPRTDELTVGFEKRFRRGFLRMSGYQRWERNLLQTRNVGIDPSSYEVFPFVDVGIDGTPGTGDDTTLPVFDQTAQLGEDRFVLDSPEGFGSSAQGVDLLLAFEHGRFRWQLAGRAYRDVGEADVGNEELQNDTGILGNLFDDPNTETNAEGRLFFDRAFTGKLSITARGPREILLGTAIRYWDGQPFARHLFFPDLGQGFVVVQALPRGRQRYAFNMTVDVRIERELSLGGTRLGLALDVFNLFNQSLHTAEDVRSGETFRDPTFAQPARTVVLEGRITF
jgi:hypothetical protein